VRSHEVQQQGYNVHHDGKCITIFSAPNYCGSERNKGAILKLDGEDELRASIIQFNAFTSKPKH
jgi:serine/threonine-protein phosphatase 5